MIDIHLLWNSVYPIAKLLLISKFPPVPISPLISVWFVQVGTEWETGQVEGRCGGYGGRVCAGRFGKTKRALSRIDMRTSWNIWGSILREIYDEMGMRLENRTFNSLLSQSGGYKLDVDYVHLLTDVENRIVAEEADVCWNNRSSALTAEVAEILRARFWWSDLTSPWCYIMPSM